MSTLASEFTVEALSIMAAEIDVEPSELADTILFADLGLDSLMIVNISGRFREELDLDVPASLFSDYPAIGDLVTFLTQKKDRTTPEFSEYDFTSSETNSKTLSPSVSSQGRQLFFKGDGVRALANVRSIIAEESGMTIEHYGSFDYRNGLSHESNDLRCST